MKIVLVWKISQFRNFFCFVFPEEKINIFFFYCLNILGQQLPLLLFFCCCIIGGFKADFTFSVALTKTSRELQNAALRTSHWLSNVSNFYFQK